MAKVIYRENPLSNKIALTIDFEQDVNAKDLIQVLKLESYPLFCKVNGRIPDLIDDDFIFKGKDIVEISPLLEGGGGDGGGKNPIATILTVVVAAAAIAVSGGALAGIGLASGSVGAALAGAAIGIGGNLLVGSLFPPSVGANAVEPTPTTGVQINDVGISAARNNNPYGKPICLPMGNCCRIAPPHGMQPYTSLVEIQSTVQRTDFFWVKNEDLAEFPCAQACFQYRPEDAGPISFYENLNSGAVPQAILVQDNGPFGNPNSIPGWFGEKQTLPGYPYLVSPMYLDSQVATSSNNYGPKKIALQARKEPCLSPQLIYGQSLASMFPSNSTNAFPDVSYSDGCSLMNDPEDPNDPVLWSDLIYPNTLNGGSTQGIALSTAYCAEKGAGTTSVGLAGFAGFRMQCWVVLCDPNDPFFGSYVRLDSLADSGFDPANIIDPEVLINGNPVLDDDGEIESMDPFCDVNAEFCVKDLINTTKKVKRVHQLFNFGYGDLKIEDSFFGTTPTTQLQEYQETFNEQGNEDWPMPDDSCVHERVDTTAGATLTHNDINSTWGGPTGVEGPETIVGADDQDQHNWVERCGVVKTDEIVVLIEGQLYTFDPQTGISSHSEVVQVQYRPYNDNGLWTSFPGSPYNLTGYDQSPVREEFSSGTVPLDKYCVRVRRVSIENGEENTTSNLNFTEVKWFQEDCKAVTKNGESVPTTYKAQNRVGICLSASGQTNGALGNYTAKVSTAMWIFDIDEFKETGVKNWVWDCEAGDSSSSNPAFAFLYFLRGGYCNGAADPTANPATSPLDGGHTSNGWHNGYHPENEELLWGAGVSEKRIDLDCICEWACYNHENDFCFDYYLCDDKPASETLDLITRAGRASWGLSDGKFCPIWEEADQPEVTIFTEENILEGSFQVCYNSRSDFSKVVVTYTAQNEELDPDQSVDDQESFDGKPIQITSDIPFSKERGGEKRIELVGVRKRKQAQREANLIAAKEFYQKRIYTWDTDIQHMCVTRGDVIRLSIDLTQPSFSSRLRSFETNNSLVTKLNLTRDMDKPITNIKIKLVCGDIINAEVTKINDKCLELITEVQASQFPIYLDQVSTCNAANLSDPVFGTYPEDIMIIGAPMSTPGKRLRITSIDVNDMCKATITAVDDDPAIYAYEFDCCPDPVVLPEQEVVPFVCAKVKDISIEDCGDGNIKVCFETEGAYGVQATYSLNGGNPVNVMSGGQFTITNNCFELELNTGDIVDIKIMPFVVGEPYSNENGCIRHVVK